AVKERIRALPAAEGEDLLSEVAGLLGSQDCELDEHARPMTRDDLETLHRLGVRIENHGWAHGDIKSMDGRQFAEHVSHAKQWLCDELAITSTQYAVPFGTDLLPPEQRAAVPGPVMLTTSEYPEGRLERDHWNRIDVTHHVRCAE